MESSSTLKKQINWKQSRELELFYQVSKRLYWSLFSIVFWKLLRLEQGKSSLFSQLQTKKNRITLQQEKVGKIYQKDLFLKGQLNILMDRHESLQKIYP